MLLVRFLRTGGREMLAMMGGSPDQMNHDQDGHDHGAPTQTAAESLEHDTHGQAGHADDQDR